MGQVAIERAEKSSVRADDGMADLIQRHDWASTSLGARSAWRESLAALVRLMLSSNQPMFMAWGPAQVWLYNDAFVPIMGDKHPALLGRHAIDEVWREARDDLAPLFARVYAGEPVQMDDLALMLDRAGRLEESHFAFSYTPVRDEHDAVVGLYGVCTETTDVVRGRIQQALVERELSLSMAEARASAERVDLALRAGAIIGTWVWAVPEDQFIADEHFAGSFGLDPLLCRTGLPLDQVMASIHPEDRERVASAIVAGLKRGGAYRCDYRVLHADGVYRWVEARGEIELGPDGAPLRFPGVLVDIDDRRRTEEALAHANNLLKTFMEAVPGVIYAKDREGRLMVANRGTAQLLGRDFDAFIGRTDAELLQDPAEAEAVMANDRRIMESGVTEQLEEQVTLADGSKAWWHSVKAPLLDDAGRVIGLIGSSVDITERRRGEEHRELLVNELNHRVKNTLAVVQGMARQTFRRPGSSDDAWDGFESRLIALSRAHNLLTDANWTSADLRQIVFDQVVLGQAEERIDVAGPPVQLDPSVSVSIALALHELRTNATKYGALSNDTGRVVVSWTVDPGQTWLALRWEESGGPPVVPSGRAGFGSRLIERALAKELGGQVRIDYLPAGVICEIGAPVSMR